MRTVAGVGFSFFLVMVSMLPAGEFAISANLNTLDFTVQKPAGRVKLIQLESYEDYQPEKNYLPAWQGDAMRTFRIKRFADGIDRLYRKFLLIDVDSGKPLGACQYVTEFRDWPEPAGRLIRPAGIKGVTCVEDINDVKELGVKYLHENLLINEFVDWANPNPEATWTFEGVDIPINMSKVQQYDQHLLGFYQAGVSVFAVFTQRIPEKPEPGNPLVHPRSNLAESPTHLGAFNIINAEGLKYYLGILEFLADRYTRADAKYGQIASYIIGNEVQQHFHWHNMGDTPEDQAVREYTTSVRLAWLALQKRHPDLRVYISMDHHWALRGFKNDPLREIPGKVLLEKIAAYAAKEGNFPWHVAFHPYPEDLFNPRFWDDKTATNDFDSPRITFKNLEVLPRFLRQEAFLYQGQPRDIALTEQGFHAQEGVEGEMVQAAAYAYAYYKVSRIPEISAFILHRHVDHKLEGGFRLGLWGHREGHLDHLQPGWSLQRDYRKRPIWNVFQKADGADWEKAFEFAKPIIGIETWGQKPDKLTK